MSTDQIASVFVPGEGLAIAYLHQDLDESWKIAYTINDPSWKSHWKFKELPEGIVNKRHKPRALSLAVDGEGKLIAVVRYTIPKIITTALDVNPNWQVINLPPPKKRQ